MKAPESRTRCVRPEGAEADERVEGRELAGRADGAAADDVVADGPHRGCWQQSGVGCRGGGSRSVGVGHGQDDRSSASGGQRTFVEQLTPGRRAGQSGLVTMTKRRRMMRRDATMSSTSAQGSPPLSSPLPRTGSSEEDSCSRSAFASSSSMMTKREGHTQKTAAGEREHADRDC